MHQLLQLQVWAADTAVRLVYLLEEIWTGLQSPGADVNGAVDLTQRKLGHKSPVVKMKVALLPVPACCCDSCLTGCA